MTDTHHTGEEDYSFVVYAADYWEHVCPTVRITGPAEFAGVNIIHGNEWQAGHLISDHTVIEKGDLVIIQRNFPQHQAAYKEVIETARSLEKIVVYELDDLIPDLPDQHPDYYHYLTSRSAIIGAIAEADAVIGSTPTLSETLRLFNSKVWTLPNYLNDRLWKLTPPVRNDSRPICIGYLGSHSHSYDLETITPVLAELLPKYGDLIQLKLWGLLPPTEIRNYPNVEYIHPGLVSYAEFAAYFSKQQCDLFIAPLVDNGFNRAKSCLKYLEYSALGVPGVYSRVTPYESVVEHGKTGYLASTHEDWEAYLVRLIEDPDLRYRMGLEAQAHIQNDWLLSRNFARWLNTYQEILSSPQPAGSHVVEARGLHKLLAWQSELESKTSLSHQNQLEIEVKNQALSGQMAALREQLTSKDEQLSALRQKYETTSKELRETRQTASHFHHMYLEIYNSRSWQLIKHFQRVRLALIPQGSQREAMIRACVRVLRYLVREGPVAFLKALRRRALGGDSVPGTPSTIVRQAQIAEEMSITNGELLKFPAISILLLQGHQVLSPEPAAIQEWLQRQTLAGSANMVTWNTQAHLAWYAEEPDTPWEAPDFQSLRSKLTTRYICIASQDLMDQPETYLEYNLITLETENLAFTVNLRREHAWITDPIQAGVLPGSGDQPLLRQVVRAECLRNDLSLQWENWNNSPIHVTGKLIIHTTDRTDPVDSLPCAQPIHRVEMKLEGRYLLTRTAGTAGWHIELHTLHPVTTVLPIIAAPSDLPTVFIIMPFIAVGGAEQIVLKNIQHNKDLIRFVILTFEEPEHELGTLDDAYRQVTPYVYALRNLLQPGLNYSMMEYLIERFDPTSIYIANGTPWIYDNLSRLKENYPNLRIANQVYDSEVGWINRYDAQLAKCIDIHLAPNTKIAEAYMQKGVPHANIRIIENGIEPDELEPAQYPAERIIQIKEKLGLPTDRRIVTFASRIHFQKRPMDFVELARRFSSEPSICFLMVGDGPMAGTVEEQTNKIGLTNFYRFPFYRPISDILALSDVIVLPSQFEGMPMIITEALAMGKPVVCTDVGNNREIIERLNGGIIVPKFGDIPTLMKGVQQMLADPPDPQKLRQAALSHWDISSISQQFYAALIGS